MRGGHLSGDVRPFVHQDDGTASHAVIAAIFAAASAVLASPRPASGVPDGPGTTAIDITLRDGTVFHHAWVFGEESPDARVAALAALLVEQHIGGW